MKTVLIPTVVMTVLTGCSAGTIGLVSGDVLDANGAQVVVVNGYGFSLRGAAVDRGLTFGFSKRTYVYPSGLPGSPAPRRYRWWVPQPAAAPVAWDSSAIGLDLQASSLAVGISLGYLSNTVLAYLPVHSNTALHLRYDSLSPDKTMMRFCNGDSGCAIESDR